ncbi:interleukin-1 receptor-associated kinase 3 isoform X2 [Brachyhypopomus gauderio]|uniref:interleukin-1 receptor-associated kinase 3 isoform X2 n=1 Tax=Brachyhypopomus gauderio TaxID=698409 RepID=UPI004042493A
MSTKSDSSMHLFDVPPLLMEMFCKVMDSCSDSLGWRGLAARILPSWLDVRCIEMHAAGGRSPTHELVWTWAQQNKTVGDLLQVLEDMGQYRALNLFQSQDFSRRTPTLSMPEPYSKEPDETSVHHSDCPFNEARRHKTLLTYSEVIQGTRNFHHDLKIGENTFADVYRGRWGNESFVVKVFKQASKASWKTLWEQFKTEIEVLQLYQHPNILDLWGSFSEGERYCLVYPFQCNGSLFQRLHEETERPLTWQERLDIIKGTAKAVHHLHTAQPCMVICGNITSSNVLLDEHLQPKLSDFGMARLRPHSINQSCTITMGTASSSNMGYLPEEYIRDGKLSVKLDVYSLGTVILETCTGRRVILETPRNMLLRDMLSLEAEEKGGVDACLHFLDAKAGQWPPAGALCLLRLGLDCTTSRARSRPCVEIVLQTLSQILPLPFCPEDQPRSLDATAPPKLVFSSLDLSYSLPMEDDESELPPVPESSVLYQRSQSGVTCPGTGDQSMCPSSTPLTECGGGAAPVKVNLEPEPDLYGSWPVECSCIVGTQTEACEDCWANGFRHTPPFIPQGARNQPFQSVVETQVKKKLKEKIELYNQGIIKTEELLSMNSE